MRAAWLLVLLIVLPLAPGSRADVAPVTLELVATEVAGTPTYLDASGAANPALHVLPGQSLTIHLVNQGKLKHGIQLDAPVSQSAPCCLAPGQEENLTVTLPDGFTGDVTYECPLHGASGMRGTLRVSPPSPTVWIVAPANGTTIHGEGVAQVEVGNATLGNGLGLVWTLDGVVTNHANGTTLPLAGLDMRDHLLQVSLVNATGAQLSADESYFYVAAPLPTTASPASSTPAGTPPPSNPSQEKIPFLGPSLVLAAGVVVALALDPRRSR